jgi:hypothetical protein
MDAERTPITSEKQVTMPKVDIVPVMKPLDIHDFLPKMEYMLKGATISTESKDLQGMLESFLKENQELINNGSEFKDNTEMNTFIEGFRNALAIVNLWIDSLHITQIETQE